MGMKLSVVGQTTMNINFKTMKTTKKVIAIVVADDGGEVLNELETLVQWGIIPKCFPLPINMSDRVEGGGTKETTIRSVKEAEHIPEKMVNIKERVASWRSDIKFNQMTEEKFEKDHELEVYDHVKKKLIKMYSDVFNEDLE